ncbi:MAG: metallophosphoesterase [Bacteroidota bacterium]
MNAARTIIIGDVHGCLRELDELLLQLKPAADDHLVFIGDLIDRGPDSAGVVKRVHALETHCRLDLVLGNHEEKLLRYLSHKQAGSHEWRNMRGIDEFDGLLLQLSDNHLQFIANAHWFIKLPEINHIAVHGGLPAHLDLSGMERLPWGMEKNLTKTFRLMNKLRFESHQGHFEALGTENSQSVYWANRYNGHWGAAVFGHHPFMQPQPCIFPNAIGLDTGCVYGGWLSAMVISNEKTEFVGVKAFDTYSKKTEYGKQGNP